MANTVVKTVHMSVRAPCNMSVSKN